MNNNNQYSLLLGAHISIAGGLDKAVERAQAIGCTCMQIFVKNNKQWKAKELEKEQIDLFKTKLKKASAIKVVVAHANYLINIGSPNEAIREKSTDSLSFELNRCQLLNIPYLVLHPGASLTGTIEESLEHIARGLNYVLKENPGNTMILLENTAGQGSAVGTNLEQLSTIYNKIIDKERVGFCFDTCHAFAAGYDFTKEKNYEDFWKKFDNILGIEKLKAIHINDSKKECGSKKDRHEHIGKGKIGLEAFRLLFNDKRFFGIPKIIETPKDDLKEDIENMHILRKMLSENTKKELGLI